MAEGLSFAELLGGLSAERFFAEHWERKPLLWRGGDSRRFQGLLTLADVESYLSRGDVRYPAVRLARGGAFYAPEAYTRDIKHGDEVFRGVVDTEKVFTEYSSGATVVLPALHLGVPPLGQLCRQLEADLDHSVHANAYLTPARTAGFAPHYDTHEVFVLQISGVKHWRVYPPPLELPHHSQTFSPEGYTVPARPLMELDLAAGDLLYLPRGHVHTTTTSDHASLHVTIGVTVYTWIEVLAELVQSGAARPGLRHALPPGFAHRPQARREFSQRLLGMMDELRASLDPETVSERFVSRVRGAQPRALAAFHADQTDITPCSRLRVSDRVDHQLLREPDGLVLRLGERRVRLQQAVGPQLEAMCRGETFTPESLPAGISLDARLALVRYLHGLGFLAREG